MDLPEPPKIVFEQPSPCADEARSIALLERTLAPTQAPSAAWTVTMRVERTAGTMVAEGEITDERNGPVAHRTFTEAGARECAALARAVGVWASLVLDAEVQRAKEPPPPRPSEPQPAAPAPPSPPPPVATPSDGGRLPPERPLVPEESAPRRLELGASTFVMGGVASEAFAGALLFTSVEVGENVFLRPSVAFGRTMESISTSDVYGTWGTARFDTCALAPGYYRDGLGLAIEICGGTELGFLHFDTPSSPPTFGAASVQAPRTTPFLALGPGVGLRGDLGGGLVAELRGLVGVNVIREEFTDSTGIVQNPPAFSARGELGLAWRVR